MKKLIAIAILTLATISVSAAAKSDTLIVTPTPMMHCSNCETKIKSNIRFVKGTKKILTSVPDQTVTIIYNPEKATEQQYIEAFKKIGYEVKKSK